LIVFLLLCYGVATIGGLVTGPSVGTWYRELAKPSFNPPDWLFGPVWTVLYAFIAVAGWSIWRLRPEPTVRSALWVYALQLFLNLSWSVLFFGLRSPAFGLIAICLLFIAIVVTIPVFWRLDQSAAWLLLPYLFWVGFAVVLNASIWALN
jgi:tryptophan-rich sensory protein